MTCETYKAVCEESGNVDPNSVCQVIDILIDYYFKISYNTFRHIIYFFFFSQIVLQSYLCEKLQDLDGIREIIARVEKLHPTTINTKAGHEFDGQAQTEDEYYDDDDYEDSSEPSTEPSTEPPKA